MSDRPANFPFYAWVPRPVGIVILLLLFVPPTFSGGAYLCNVGEMVGGLGVWAEDVQMASFCTSIGMCLFPPFMVRFLQARRVRHTYLWCFGLLAVLNGACAVTTWMPLLWVCCLLTGVVRIMVMLNCTFTIAPYLTGMDTLAMFSMTEEPSPQVQYGLERKRTLLMPVLYGVILVISQCSNRLLAWCAYACHWQDAYYVVVGMLLVGMALVTLTMPGEERHTYSMEWGKLPGAVLMMVALCCMAYVLVYGKTLDWLQSASIVWALAVMLIAIGAFLLYVVRMGDDSYLPLSVLGYRNVVWSMLLFLVLMALNSANSLVLAYAQLSTAIDGVLGASLSMWAVVGCLVGVAVSVGLVIARAHFRVAFCLAFVLMAAANAYFYFQYQTVGLFDNMAVPMVLNFAGLLMIYSLAAAWGMKGLPARYLATYVFLMIWMRNAIAPVVGASAYSNALYHRQQYSVERLAQGVDAQNVAASAAYGQTRRAGLARGDGSIEADRRAAAMLRGRVARQATLVAMRDVTGSTVVLVGLSALAVLVLPYRRGETM